MSSIRLLLYPLLLLFATSVSSANSDELGFRKFDDANFFRYGVKLVHNSTRELKLDTRGWKAIPDTVADITHNTPMYVFTLSNSFHLFDIGSRLALRLEPEIMAAFHSSNQHLGFLLPLRLQFGAMSSAENYERFGIGFKAGFGNVLLSSPVGETDETVPTGWSYALVATGFKLGTTTMSLELGYSSWDVKSDNDNGSRRTSQFLGEAFSLGAIFSGFDL